MLAYANVEMSSDPSASVKNLGMAPHRSVALAMGGSVRTEQKYLILERMPYWEGSLTGEDPLLGRIPYWEGSLTGCQPSSRFS